VGWLGCVQKRAAGVDAEEFAGVPVVWIDQLLDEEAQQVGLAGLTLVETRKNGPCSK
jgi:hypothetical protein